MNIHPINSTKNIISGHTTRFADVLIKYNNIQEKELYEIIWKDIKEKVNKFLPNYKHIKKLIISNEPMIKTTTQKIKRFEEIKKIVND